MPPAAAASGDDPRCAKALGLAGGPGWRATEPSVGAGIKQSGIKREEIFITSKLWKSDMGYEQAKKGFQTSIDKLGTDYLDLYLIHRPGGDVKGSWKAMEEL